MSASVDVLTFLDDNRSMLEELELDVWMHPQIGFHEEYAASLLSGVLQEAGFSVQRNIAGLPTAFVAEWGSGQPVVGFLGEYDALPGMSQKVQATKEPIEKGAAGHACGHNLLGVGSLGAVLALKKSMESGAITGTLRYYGCPAEETLIGKVFMARVGAFDDLDAALSWHPFYANTVWNSQSMAMNSFKLNFHGASAHAANAPHLGRSALDGVMLTDIGVNYMREHMISDARVHCVITNGGEAPNIVPEYAQVWYYVRAPFRVQVDELYQRVIEIAKGAAIMTQTTVDVELLAGCYDYLPNRTIGAVMARKLEEMGGPEFDDADIAWARELQRSLPPEQIDEVLRLYGKSRQELGDPLSFSALEDVGSFCRGQLTAASTDVGDVSYITPTAQITTCCVPLGTAIHSWQSCASTGSAIGAKGMMLAAKVLAMTGLDLFTNPTLVKAARDELVTVTRGNKYVSPLPEGLEPPTL